MACNTPPEVPCGSTLPDTCIIFTSEILPCFEYTGPCISRQSQFNNFVQTELCGILTILGDISTALDWNITTPTCWVGPWVEATSIATAINPIWTYICANQGMGTPITGVDPKCLVDPCGDPITTLGQTLQGLIDKQCANGIYRANITQVGGAAPVVTVLENTIGAIVWTRAAAGDYRGTLLGAFTPNKTFLMMNNVNGSIISFSRLSTNAVNIITPLDTTLLETSIEIRIYP